MPMTEKSPIAVWALYDQALARSGACAYTDRVGQHIPPWAVLFAEAMRRRRES